MQNVFSLSRRFSLFCAATLLSLQGAQAQIVTSNSALDQLGSAPEKARPAAPAKRANTTTTREKSQSHAAAHKPAQETNTHETEATTQASTTPPVASGTGATTSTPAPTPAATHTPGHPPPAATIPAAPPPPPVLTPTPEIALHPFPIPPQPTVVVTATGTATPIAGGVRITFAPGSDELNPATHQAILTYGQSLADKPNVRAIVMAYSSGAPNDPSLPRRMALLRGLAARSVLMNSGIPSTRIYVRVIGQPAAGAQGAPQDYIDLVQSDSQP
ncbi:OmpA family protein [Acetobacter papayae]|uniref:OmpA family protein n=1 Tax=Acetobacter papayae TaxID=1076592 RepID=UPI0039ED62ED